MIIEQLGTIIMMRRAFINIWNLVDLVALVLIIALFIADAIIDDFYASAVFKIRALFRIYKVTIHIMNISDPVFTTKK